MRLVSIALGIAEPGLADLIAVGGPAAPRLVVLSGDGRPPGRRGGADVAFLPPVPPGAPLHDRDVDAIAAGITAQCAAPGLVEVARAAAPTFLRVCRECGLIPALARAGVAVVFSAQAASDEAWAASLAEAAALARRSRATLNVVQPPRAALPPDRELALRGAAAAWAVRPVAAPTALAAPRGRHGPDGMTPSGTALATAEAARFRAEIFAPRAPTSSAPPAGASPDAAEAPAARLSPAAAPGSPPQPPGVGRRRVIPTLRGPVNVVERGTCGAPLVPSSALDAATGGVCDVLLSSRDYDRVLDFWKDLPVVWLS